MALVLEEGRGVLLVSCPALDPSHSLHPHTTLHAGHPVPLFLCIPLLSGDNRGTESLPCGVVRRRGQYPGCDPPCACSVQPDGLMLGTIVPGGRPPHLDRQGWGGCFRVFI